MCDHIGLGTEGHSEVVGRDDLPIDVFAPGNQAWFVILRDCNGGNSRDATL